jgi:voltage-gated potassium channel
MLVEHVHWFDALYMTVITLSTVGFGEVIPLSRSGRLFTMGLIIVGVGTAAYFITSMAHLLAVDVLSKLATVNSMQNRIDRMSRHVIVCGYGSLGRTVADELTRGNIPIVIIERDPAKQSELEQSKRAFLLGNATSDEVLVNAGLDRARALVAGTGSDPDNVFITLAARERRPELLIHARGETTESIRRLKQAGASYVLSPLQMGGMSLAASISRPSVAQFLQITHPRAGSAVDLEEVHVMQGARLIGRTLGQLEGEHQRLRIVAMVRGERTDLIPETSLRIEAGDHLVVIGDRKSLEQLATWASKPAEQPGV